MITGSDEQAIKMLHPGACQAAVDQDGTVQKNTAVAEITRLMRRAGDWPPGLQWIVRRTKPSRRQAKNLTEFEKKTGWPHSVIVTNIPDTGIPGVAGSHHPQFIDVLHREHAVIDDRAHKQGHGGCGACHMLKTWQVNCGWVLAANIAAGLDAWCRLLGLYDQASLKAMPGS